jgi:hypothetical protein
LIDLSLIKAGYIAAKIRIAEIRKIRCMPDMN